MLKVRVLHNSRPVSSRSSRYARDPTIQTDRSRDVDLAKPESPSGERFPTIELESGGSILPASSVEASDGTDTLIGLEACEHVREDGRWPEDVVIGEYNDLASCPLDSCD